ncbi:hypothetical protein QFC24_000712 [Naganishia onofrii]|uniref:Uncharacterized protein n=1 Tax=Naganishia onofrii TaxID=1851511 RepID=A0ACC2XVC7_9TREE|nr:hypothetical protein QFC24_000712 [Naganishia onofrii]
MSNAIRKTGNLPVPLVNNPLLHVEIDTHETAGKVIAAEGPKPTEQSVAATEPPLAEIECDIDPVLRAPCPTVVEKQNVIKETPKIVKPSKPTRGKSANRPSQTQLSSNLAASTIVNPKKRRRGNHSAKEPVSVEEKQQEDYAQRILLNEVIIYLQRMIMDLESNTTEELLTLWGGEDYYADVQDPEQRLELMRYLVVRKELERLGAEEPDDWTIWSMLMEERNKQRSKLGLPLEGEMQVGEPTGGKSQKPLERCDRRRTKVSYKE